MTKVLQLRTHHRWFRLRANLPDRTAKGGFSDYRNGHNCDAQFWMYAPLPDIGSLPRSGRSAHREPSGSMPEITGISVGYSAA